MTNDSELLAAAMAGDIDAFQRLFAAFQPQLKSFLYRLTADRHDADDLTHDTFVRAFDKLKTYRGEAGLKTWVFRIGANLARDAQRKKKPWPLDAQDRARSLAESRPDIQTAFYRAHVEDSRGAYDVAEHIDFCFTCIGKTLPIEQQIAVILKDMYAFGRKEIATVLSMSEGVVKHLLHDGRKVLSQVFYERCALVNKNGACNQCSELAGIYNPRQAKREHLVKLEMVRAGERTDDAEKLYALRAGLVKFIHPLNSQGADLQDVIMQCTRMAVGEKDRL
ncbi:RNA polymerase sigma factor [Lewinella sp. 4G2]|uniref:RNA polymerase sigma factor n=1 Tax=Lewinella sp. 4G2 TaxID=1803372 RepID=UPI0007B4B109|nr:RNA polymerase sigma factor [Lewinella sp. 4G2]OAV43826.1 RNA polymerase subunit sigma-24 [Lewinella sp. 4G2]